MFDTRASDPFKVTQPVDPIDNGPFQECPSWVQRFENYLSNVSKRIEIPSNDAAHDLSHVRRVWELARTIAQNEEGVDGLVLAAMCFFHDVVNLPKDHPEREFASAKSAVLARSVLKEMRFPEEKLNIVYDGIISHSYSAGKPCYSIEAKILQDADRLDALGAIGLARLFYTAGRLNSQLYDLSDPNALKRDLSDKQFAIDHLKSKIFRLPLLMNTDCGKKLATQRVKFMEGFLQVFLHEAATLQIKTRM